MKTATSHLTFNVILMVKSHFVIKSSVLFPRIPLSICSLLLLSLSDLLINLLPTNRV